MVRIILISLLLVNIAFADVQVSVDKTKMSRIEHLQVIIQVSNLSANQPFDISALSADFKIINQSKSSISSFINGRGSNRLDLKLRLAPKRTGELLIPAFKVGSKTSNPIKIKVLDVDEFSFEAKPIFIKTKLNNVRPMVQQQLIYTVSLYSRVNLQNPKLDFTPPVTDAKVKKIVDSKSEMVKFKQQNLWKKDFNFAIYPQKIGKLSIPDIKLEVFINQSERVLLFAKATDLTVLPSAINYPPAKYWLPATQVELIEKPFDKSQKIIVGEPIVRKIIIKVASQSADQVPAVALLNNDTFEQYLDHRSSSEQLSSTDVISTIEQDILLIANQSGPQILPEITLNWFDTNENKAKIARIPAIKVVVKPPLVPSKILTQPTLKERDIEHTQRQSTDQAERVNWQIIAMVSMALWLLSALLFFIFYQRLKPKKTNTVAKVADIHSLKMIKKYAKKNDMRATKQALDAWVFEQYGLLDTNSFAHQLDAHFAAEVLILQQNLYQSNANWNGKKFYQTFAVALKSNTPKQDSTGLSNLYPD